MLPSVLELTDAGKQSCNMAVVSLLLERCSGGQRLLASRSFYINLVVAAVSAPAVIFCIPNYQPPSSFSFFHKLSHLDWLGITLHAAIYLTYLLALTFGGAQWAWNDGRTITVLTMFGVTLLAFILTQRYSVLTTAERRIYPVRFLRRRTFLILYAVTACAATSIFIPVYVSLFAIQHLQSLIYGR
jgi:hypothetical protein